MNLNHVALTVADVRASAEFYQSLGLTNIVNTAQYARLRCPEGGATVSLIGTPGAEACGSVTLYLEAADVREAVRRLKQLGHAFLHDVVMQPWGWQEARLTDPSGHTICLFHAGAKRFCA
jgi:hydroxymethylpyrimidine/phosphomethylpyrimidine kinase